MLTLNQIEPTTYLMNYSEQVEKEFLQIEPLDGKQLFPFYEKHRDYFDGEPPQKLEHQERFLEMLAEIAATLAMSNAYVKALPKLGLVISGFEKNEAILINSDVAIKAYHSAVFWKAHSLASLDRYWAARSFMKNVRHPNGPHQDKLDDYLMICNYKLRNKGAIWLGVFGFILLAVKYSIRWSIPEWYSIQISSLGIVGSIMVLVAAFLHKKGKINRRPEEILEK